MSTLDPQLLRTLATVAEMKSFTRAAKLLHLTQSTTSLQIQRLEEQLGVTLLSRSKRGVELTSTGAAFLPYAQRILALHDEAVRSVVGSSAGAQVRVGLPDVEAVRYLPGALRALEELHPGVQPMVHCDVSTVLEAMFEAGELDVCLVVQHGAESRGTRLGHDALAWVAAPGFELVEGEPVPLALYPEYCIFRAHALRALAAAGRSWRIAYCSQSTAAIDIAVECGWAVAIKSVRTVADDWAILGEADGMPPLDGVSFELRQSTTMSAPARALAELLASAVRAELAPG